MQLPYVLLILGCLLFYTPTFTQVNHQFNPEEHQVQAGELSYDWKLPFANNRKKKPQNKSSIVPTHNPHSLFSKLSCSTNPINNLDYLLCVPQPTNIMYPLHVSARTSSDASLHRPLPFTQSQRFIDPAKNIIFSNNGANFLTPIDDQLPFATHEPMSGSHDAESGPDGGFDMSDAQIKKNVRENVPGLAFIGALRPVTYRLDIAGLQARQQPNPNTVADARYSTTHTTKKPRITGFIAQEVASAAERIGFEFSGIDKPDSPEELYALRYSTFVVPLVKATQEQQEEITALKKEVRTQHNIIQGLQIQQEELRAQLEKMELLFDHLLDNGPDQEEVHASLQLQPYLGQNGPNPFRRQTRIGYFIPPGFNQAAILITNSEGKEIRRIMLIQSGRSSLELRTRSFPPGNYQYSLVVDGKLIDTKQMIVVR